MHYLTMCRGERQTSDLYFVPFDSRQIDASFACFSIAADSSLSNCSRRSYGE